MVPQIDHQKCQLCDECVNFCRFHALIHFIDKIRLLPNLCHACGGCQLVCPHQAITEVDELIGWVHHKKYQSHDIYGGELMVGKETGVKIISTLLDKPNPKQDVVIDCPPGNGCSVMESMKSSDVCVLVTEPTMFGLENLKMVYKLTKVFNKKSGIVINKSYHQDDLIIDYANTHNIPILGVIPFDKALAKDNSNLLMISDNEDYKDYFLSIYARLLKVVES
ncbi:MAG: 4Fe-4S binding protein [Acholeplasmataceae bacterium]